jgi:hypothetical protein
MMGNITAAAAMLHLPSSPSAIMPKVGDGKRIEDVAP